MIILLFGPPCSGKGSISKRLASDQGVTTITPGEIYRNFSEKRYPKEHYLYPFQIEWKYDGAMKKGGLIPDSFTNSVMEAMFKNTEGTGAIVFDDYPRNVAQANAFTDFARGYLSDVFIIELNTPQMFLQKRAVNRAREDKNPTVLAHRISIYNTFTISAIDYLRKEHHICFECILGIGSKDEVFDQVMDLVKKFELREWENFLTS